MGPQETWVEAVAKEESPSRTHFAFYYLEANERLRRVEATATDEPDVAIEE